MKADGMFKGAMLAFEFGADRVEFNNVDVADARLLADKMAGVEGAVSGFYGDMRLVSAMYPNCKRGPHVYINLPGGKKVVVRVSDDGIRRPQEFTREDL